MSKKVIRLTESELKRYINKVVSEQTAPKTGTPSGTATPTAKPATPKVPVSGGSEDALKKLVGKAVLLRDYRNAYYSCVITNGYQTDDNVIYINVKCENEPAFQWIKYKIHGDGHLYIGGSTKAPVELQDGDLLKYLVANVKPYYNEYDFTSKVNSPNGGNHDFQS